MSLPTLFQMRFLGRGKKSEDESHTDLDGLRSRTREVLPESASLSELFSALGESDQWDVARPQLDSLGIQPAPYTGPETPQVTPAPQQVASEQRREPIPEAVRHEVWQRDQGRCVDCGARERLEFDHIIPVSKGGNNTTRNIELRCETCNRNKGDRI